MTGHYVGPVILADEMEAKLKQRLVTIDKESVYGDIDKITSKHVDAREDMGVRSGNAVSSDTTEDVDGAVIARYVELRNAKLRMRLQHALRDEEVYAATDEITLDDKHYYYAFEVTQEFHDNTLRPLAEYIHNYLLFGALADWYDQFGYDKLSEAYAKRADSLEDKIDSITRGPSIVKKPLQPFGPAERIY